MRILLDDDSSAGSGAPSDQRTESTPAPAPAAVPTPAPAGPPVPAADTVIAGPITEDTELLRVKLTAAEKRAAELEGTVKEREQVISNQQDDHDRYRKSVETPATKPIRVGMFRKG